MSEDHSSTRDAHLLGAALALADATDIPGMLAALRPVFTTVRSACVAGLTLREQEREAACRYLLDLTCPDRPATSEDIPLEHSELALLAAGEPPSATRPTARCVAVAQHPALLETLGRTGARQVLLAPLRLHDRLIGTVLVGLAADQPASAEDGHTLARLGRIVTPAVWSGFARERFRRGDRRRDTLISLMTALNASREPDAIIGAACAALDSIESEAGCAIDLLAEDRRQVRSYPAGGPRRAYRYPPRGPLTLPLRGSLVEWLIDHPETYESPDLTQTLRLSADAPLRDAGVRRYVLTPMIAQGRVLGALLVGSTDPHPPLRIDVWLYETIALQVGLAIENTRQFRRLQEASEKLAQQNIYLREEIRIEQVHGQMVGRSPALEKVRQAIARVAPTDTTVLITGETGVGKELVARAIHDAGRRADKPMVKVNCAAIPESMVESELFGHERGAFTSAVAQRIGRFELAHDSTLFLDEVGELPPAVQAKLLRVLQDGEFERVGGARTLHSNARIVAATNRDLLAAVNAGTFRRDLYYRLSVFPIHVPALARRREDIPLLVEQFMAYFSRRTGKHFEAIEPDSLERLVQRNWPGNIRELRHAIERAMILCDPPLLRVQPAHGSDVLPQTRPPTAATDPSRPLHEVEAEHIERVLAATGGVIEGPRGAARALGLHPSTLRSRMKRLGITRPHQNPR